MPSYNNYFPMNYPAYAQQAYQQNYQPVAPVVSQPVAQTNNGIIWVQGEAGAKAYPVGSGNSVLLMDSESEQFYIKSTDVSGMPMPLRVFSYKEVVQTQETAPKGQIDMSMYITRDELENRLNALTKSSNTAKRYKREEIEDE